MHFQKRGQNLHQSKRKNKRTRTTHTHTRNDYSYQKGFSGTAGRGVGMRSRQDLFEKKRVFHPYDVKGKANGNFLVFFREKLQDKSTIWNRKHLHSLAR